MHFLQFSGMPLKLKEKHIIIKINKNSDLLTDPPGGSSKWSWLTFLLSQIVWRLDSVSALTILCFIWLVIILYCLNCSTVVWRIIQITIQGCSLISWSVTYVFFHFNIPLFLYILFCSCHTISIHQVVTQKRLVILYIASEHFYKFLVFDDLLFYFPCIWPFRSEQLCWGLYVMGFNKPSKIQEEALPMLLADLWVWCQNAIITNLHKICDERWSEKHSEINMEGITKALLEVSSPLIFSLHWSMSIIDYAFYM